MSEPCPIAASVAKRVTDRAQVGLDKYATNLTRIDLSHTQWLQHLQDELLDAANYVERLKVDATELTQLRTLANDQAKAFKKYAVHSPYCIIRKRWPSECDCGYDNALALIAKCEVKL